MKFSGLCVPFKVRPEASSHCKSPRGDRSSPENSDLGNHLPAHANLLHATWSARTNRDSPEYTPRCLTHWWWMPWKQGRGPGGFSPGAGGWRQLHQSQQVRPGPVSRRLRDVYTVGKNVYMVNLAPWCPSSDHCWSPLRERRERHHEGLCLLSPSPFPFLLSRIPPSPFSLAGQKHNSLESVLNELGFKQFTHQSCDPNRVTQSHRASEPSPVKWKRYLSECRLREKSGKSKNSLHGAWPSVVGGASVSFLSSVSSSLHPASLRPTGQRHRLALAVANGRAPESSSTCVLGAKRQAPILSL